jgi:uncharacterized membrane protein YfhO
MERNIMEKNETFMSAFDRAFVDYTRLMMIRVLCRFGFHPVYEKTGLEAQTSAAFIDACLYLNDEIEEKEKDVRFKFKKAYGEELPEDPLEMVQYVDKIHGPEAHKFRDTEFDLKERLSEFEKFLKGEDHGE